MKNLTDFRKTVETGVDPRLGVDLRWPDHLPHIVKSTCWSQARVNLSLSFLSSRQKKKKNRIIMIKLETLQMRYESLIEKRCNSNFD